MQEHVCAFLKSVSEAFPLQGPIYEFGYGPGVDAAGRPAGTGLPEDASLAWQQPESGPGETDRLEDMARLPFPDGAARTVISINTLEHVFEPRKAVEEMIRILAPGGILLISSASGSRLPDLPDCYWQPTPRALQMLLADLEVTLVGWQGSDHCVHTLFGVGAKPPVSDALIVGLGRFLDRFQKRLDGSAAQLGWWQRVKRMLTAWAHPESSGRNPHDSHSPAATPDHTAPGKGRASVRAAREFYRAQFVLHLPVRRQLKHHLLAACLPDEKTGTRLDTGP